MTPSGDSEDKRICCEGVSRLLNVYFVSIIFGLRLNIIEWVILKYADAAGGVTSKILIVSPFICQKLKAHVCLIWILTTDYSNF